MNKLAYNAYHLFPSSLTQYLDCLRRRKYWKENKLIFIHVPKAAGTSVSHAIYGRSLGHFKASEIKRWCPNEFTAFYKFAFVRNPWDRAVSAYRFALKGRTDTAGINNWTSYRTAEFKTFESFVYEWLLEQDLAKIDNVFQPQYLYVVDANEELLVDDLYKVEKFEDEILRVSQKCRMEIKILDLNRITYKGEYVKYYQNSAVINTVGDIYQKDVSLFGYDFQ